MKKFIVILGVLLLFGAVLIWNHDFPKHIDLQYPAVQYHEDNPSTARMTTINIKGELKRPLFRNQTFAGEFQVEGYDYTHDFYLFDIIFHQGRGFLFYFGNVGHLTEIQSLGAIWVTEDLEQMLIFVLEDSDDSRSSDGQSPGLRIAAPAESYDEAVRIEKLVIEKVNSQSR